MSETIIPPTISQESEPPSITSPPVPRQPTATASAPSIDELLPSPKPRRPRPPKKGILKPPPPPTKPGLGGKLRDALGSFNPRMFEGLSVGESGARVRGDGGQASIVGGGAGGTTTAVLNGVGDAVGGAAAIVGNWGGRFGRLIGANLPQSGTVGNVVSKLSEGKVGGVGNMEPMSTVSTSTAAVSLSTPTTSRTIPLPSNNPSVTNLSASQALNSTKPLKQASFLLPSMSITYPISTSTPAWSDKNTSDRMKIEQSKAEELKAQAGKDYWTREKLALLYESACKGREEVIRLPVRNAILASIPSPNSRTTTRQLHLSSSLELSSTSDKSIFKVDPMDRHACEALADVLCLDWGLEKLVLENGVLDGDDCLKPILHALLISGTLPYLSIAGNKKLKPQSFRIVSVYLRKAKALKYLDISDNILDRKSVEYLCHSLVPSKDRPNESTDGSPRKLPPPINRERDFTSASTVTTVTTDSHGEKEITSAQEASQATNEGAEIGLERDDDEETPRPVFVPCAPLLRDDSSQDALSNASVRTLRMDGCSLKAASLEILGTAIRHSEIQNLSLRRNKISNLGAVAVAVMMKDYPDGLAATSHRAASTSDTQTFASSDNTMALSHLGGVSAVESASMSREPSMDEITPRLASAVDAPRSALSQLPTPATQGSGLTSPATRSLAKIEINGKVTEPKTSMALTRQLNFLKGVETVGHLQTLDLKGNEIRGGVNYIAQVLKRNRTLKVLNLSDNRIDQLGLAALAESLKYNATLETLDLSQNPCCGPALDGVLALRDAVTVNKSLKRLMLSGTHLVTDGAIILAEYLPEASSLLHVDLADNPGISEAGVMALSVAIRSNHIIRCLDLTVPAKKPDFANLCQPILQACIRNTEAFISAKEGKLSASAQDVLWTPIRKSSLVKSLRSIEAAKAIAEVQKAVDTPAGRARELVYGLKPDGVLKACEETAEELQAFVTASGNMSKVHKFDRQDARLLLERGKTLLERVADLIQDTTEAERLERLLSLNDLLTPLLASAQSIVDNAARRRPLSAEVNPSHFVSTPSPSRPMGGTRRHIRIPSMEMSSPNFSITNSDEEDSDAEEVALATQNVTGMHTPTRVIGGRKATATLSLEGIGLARADSPMRPREGDPVGENAEATDIQPDSCASPLERVNRDWMAEEGEIFRKGSKLGVAEEEEVEKMDVSGDDLKLRILDTEVERSPHKPIKVDEVDDELNDNHDDERDD